MFQRESADYLEVDPDKTSLTGTNGNLQFGKAAEGHWRFETGGTWRSPELEMNDIGFQRQADDIRHYTWVGWRTIKADSTFRQLGINYNHWSAWDFGGNHNMLRFNANSWANLQNNWFVNAGFNYAPIRYDNFALRGGPRLRLSPDMGFWTGINTDNRKKIRFGVFQNGRKGLDNSFSRYSIEFGATYQPINALRISAWPNIRINRDKLQFVTIPEVNGNPVYLNGEIKQETLSMSLRVNYTINPNLTIQYWGQPFISQGRYQNFKKVTDATAEVFEDRFLQYSDSQISFADGTYSVDENLDGNTDFSFGNPDFSFIQFRSNLVLRWEYIPGSEIFLVWSQDISQAGDPQDPILRSLGDNLFGGMKPMNIFLLKATYRFVL